MNFFQNIKYKYIFIYLDNQFVILIVIPKMPKLKLVWINIIEVCCICDKSEETVLYLFDRTKFG